MGAAPSHACRWSRHCRQPVSAPWPCPPPPRCLQEEVIDDNIFPGLITLDTGQPPGGGPVAAATAPRAPAAPSRRAPATCRGWWPSWPLAPATIGGQLSLVRRSTSISRCLRTANGSAAAEAAVPPMLTIDSTAAKRAARSEGAPDLPSSPSGCHTPPRTAAGTAAAAPTITTPPASPSPVTPLSLDGWRHPGSWAGRHACRQAGGQAGLPSRASCCAAWCAARAAQRKY